MAKQAIDIIKVESKVLQRLSQSDFYEKVFTRQEILLLAVIIGDIEKAGYRLPELKDKTPIVLVVPACAVNAPHRRDRVWIVAHAQSLTGDGHANESGGKVSTKSLGEQQLRGGKLFSNAKTWDINSREVLESSLCGADDGLPAWVHRHRVARLKALGNAIVPQIAEEIGRMIMAVDQGVLELKT